MNKEVTHAGPFETPLVSITHATHLFSLRYFPSFSLEKTIHATSINACVMKLLF